MSGRQVTSSAQSFSGCSEEKVDLKCLSFEITILIFCDSHTKKAAAAVTLGGHGGCHPPGTANCGGKEKVLRSSSLSFAEKTTSHSPERPSVAVGDRCIPNRIVRKTKGLTKILGFHMALPGVAHRLKTLHITLFSYDTFLGLARGSADFKSWKITQGN